jgi:hypothetical protein
MVSKSLSTGVLLLISWVGAASAVAGADAWAAQRKKIAEMSPAEKQQLLRKQERFAALPLEDQQRLERLHEQLETDIGADKLRRVMSRYYEWLGTLSPGQRAELFEKTPDERVAVIKKLKADQAQPPANAAYEGAPLPPQDAQKVIHWLENLAWSRREELLKHLKPAERKRIEGLDEARQRAALLPIAWRRWHGTGTGVLASTGRDGVRELVQQLSPPVRQRLEAAQTPEQKQQQFRQLMQSALGRRIKTGGRMTPPVNQEDLERFFTRDLNADERERLLGLSADEMQRELRKMYWQRQLGDHGSPQPEHSPRGPRIVPSPPPPPPPGGPDRKPPDR